MHVPNNPLSSNTIPLFSFVNRWRMRCYFVLCGLALACLALLPIARGADLGAGNTADGDGALFNLTTGTNNTAIGFEALFKNTSGIYNTATGSGALHENVTGQSNAAFGLNTLFNNTGFFNTGSGAFALLSNGMGSYNTASGFAALYNNQVGHRNTASGYEALYKSTTSDNTASGYNALANSTTGLNNIAIGSHAGENLTTGSNNIYIGSRGVAGDGAKIRIGTKGTQNGTFLAGIYNINEPATTSAIKPVYINSNGQLGTAPPASSRRFKEEIKPMDKTSQAILGLKPVTFQYKDDSTSTPQFGLIAEEVAKANPDLVIRDENGEIYTVRYDAVNAMLLNEFLKEHRKVEELKASIAQEKAANAQQEKEIKTLIASLKEQASAIRKVSDRLKLNKPSPQVVTNDQ